MRSDFLKFRSLESRVTLLTLALFVVSIWSLSYYASYLLRQDMRRLVSDQQFATASILADEVNQELLIRFLALQTVAKSITPAQLASPTVLQQLLVDRPVLQNFFNGGTYVAGPDGIAKADYPLVSKRTIAEALDPSCLEALRQGGQHIVGKPLLGENASNAVIPMAVPLQDAKGQFIGALVGEINLGMPNFLDVITENRYGKHGGYLIVSRAHRLIVAASDKSRAMQALPPRGDNQMIDRLMDGYEGTAILMRDNGEEVLNSGKRIAASDWAIVASLPTSEAFAPLVAMQRRVMLAAVVFTLVAGGLIWWSLRRQLAPAFETIKTLATLADTDQIPQALPVVRQDEIGKLITGFNGLLKTMQLQAMALRVSDQALRDISQAVVITDAQQNIISSNEAYLTITGYDQKEIIGLNCRFLQGPQTDALAIDAIRLSLCNSVTFSGEVLNYRKDGTPFWNDLTISPMRDPEGHITHYIGVTRDVTERKTAESNVRQLAFYDALTNLPNRRLLKDRLTQAIAASKRTAFYGAVMFMDLDNFKQLNDTHGHVAGDLLLEEVANRLRQCVREVDTLARFGGDEFVVVLNELDSDKTESALQAAAIAEKIRAAVSHPYHLALKYPAQTPVTVEHHCTASIGVALFLGQEATEDDLLKWADTAMYQAKAAGRNVVRFFGVGG